jgi:hypothetical protein
VARRIEIELTSARPDGSWTWRAAGAREPKGVLDGGLLYEGAKPGDVVRAEADFEIDGITIVAVTAPKGDDRRQPERIEIIGPSRSDTPGVTTQLVGRSDRRPGDRRRDRDDSRARRDGDDGRPRRDREDSRGRRSDRRPDSDTRPGSQPGQGADATRPSEGTERRPREGSGGRPDHGRREGAAIERRAAGNRPARQPAASRERVRRPDGDGRPERSERRPAPAAAGQPKPRRFNPGHTHRQAVMASLAPEEQPIAEQVLRGGIPAVRTALHLERETATAQGRPVPNTDQLIAMAEALLPRLKAAEWRDRAEAAAKEPDAIALRDLRAVVAGADVARDDEARTLAAGLRQALERRVAAMRNQWAEEVVQHLNERRVVRALRLAGRPPEPAARLEPAMLDQLAAAASEAMSPETPPERWVALIEAVAASPVRRDVKPLGFPAEPGAELRKVAHQQSGRIPALAAMLGIAIPPPPTPSRSGPPARPPRPPRPGRRERERPERPPASDRVAKAGPTAATAPAGEAAPTSEASPSSEGTPPTSEAAPTSEDAPAASEDAPPSGAVPTTAVAPAAPADEMVQAVEEVPAPEPAIPDEPSGSPIDLAASEPTDPPVDTTTADPVETPPQD